MKTILAILMMLTLMVSGCESGPEEAAEEVGRDVDQAEAKVNQTENEDREEPLDLDEEQVSEEEDLWVHYEDATWEDNYNGLVTEIVKVAVSDQMPTLSEPEDFSHSAVGVQFRIENTTEEKFVTYPDQATLVTSTGEQIDMPDMWLSDNIGGEINRGVIKEGGVFWYLERGHAEEIEWILLEWSTRQGSERDFGSERIEYEVELKLQ